MASRKVKDWYERIGQLIEAEFEFVIDLNYHENHAVFSDFDLRYAEPVHLRIMADMFNRAADLLEEVN